MTRNHGLTTALALSAALLLQARGEDAEPALAKFRGMGETLFAKLRASDKPQESPVWQEFLKNPAAAAIAHEHLSSLGEPERGRAAALASLAQLEGAVMAEDCAKYALYARTEQVQQVARASLRGIRTHTPDTVIKALRAPEEIGLRALDLIKDNPDEKGLYGLVVAADEVGYGGAGARGYIFSGTQYAYVKGMTAVVQVNAVGYNPEVDYVQTATVLDAKVLKTEAFRRTLYEISGITFDTPGKAWDWWEAHKGEVAKRIEERSGGKAPAP